MTVYHTDQTGKHDPLCPILDPPPYDKTITCGCTLIARTRAALSAEIRRMPGVISSNVGPMVYRDAVADLVRGTR